jgi:hypothetical protein
MESHSVLIIKLFEAVLLQPNLIDLFPLYVLTDIYICNFKMNNGNILEMFIVGAICFIVKTI